MAKSDICDHTDIRIRHGRKTMHLPKLGNAHLKDCHLMFRADLKDRERKPDLIVEISFGL